MDIYDFNKFNELDKFGLDEIVEEYDAETVLNAKDGNWEYQEMSDEEPKIIYGNKVENFYDGLNADSSSAKKQNIKYSTQASKVNLKDLSARLENIDSIKVINNPINAKISFDNNLVSVAKQGVDGMVQLEVSGHKFGENNSSNKANIFIQMD